MTVSATAQAVHLQARRPVRAGGRLGAGGVGMVRRSVVVFDQQEGCLGRLNGGRGASAPRQHFGVCVLGRPWVESMLIADARGGVFWGGCFDCRDSWEIVGWGWWCPGPRTARTGMASGSSTASLGRPSSCRSRSERERESGTALLPSVSAACLCLLVFPLPLPANVSAACPLLCAFAACLSLRFRCRSAKD